MRNFTNGEQIEPMQFCKLLLVDAIEENSKLDMNEETGEALRPSIIRTLKIEMF